MRFVREVGCLMRGKLNDRHPPDVEGVDGTVAQRQLQRVLSWRKELRLSRGHDRLVASSFVCKDGGGGAEAAIDVRLQENGARALLGGAPARAGEEDQHVASPAGERRRERKLVSPSLGVQGEPGAGVLAGD